MIDVSPQIRPVVGISGGNSDSASVRAMITQIASTGAIPMFLGNHSQRNADEDIKKIDALVVMGNNSDIDPECYGQPKHKKTISELDNPKGIDRAKYETAIMEKALESGMPLLGVCGGMQRLNVILKGSLHQHVPDLIGNDDHAQHLHNVAPFIPVQPIHIVKDSVLGNISDSNPFIYAPTPARNNYTYDENSMHHQAVNLVGNGLRVSAHAEDTFKDGSKLIEAIEANPNGKFGKQFILGVQWHPEFSANELGAKIATRLAQEAQKFAEHHRPTRPSEQQVQKENRISSLDTLETSKTPTVDKKGGMVEAMLKRRVAQDNAPRL
jgi:putative glutamine amidotransferase